jgi:hypothetical protein
MATNPEPKDPSTAVALQAWTNDKLVAAEKLVEARIRDLKELIDVQIRDLKNHNEKILIEKDNALRAALAAAEKAVQKAEDNAEKWRANANEWRAAMTDKDKLLLQRTEFETYKSTMTAALAVETKRADFDQGKSSGLNAGWIILVAAVGLIATIIVTAIAIVARFK